MGKTNIIAKEIMIERPMTPPQPRSRNFYFKTSADNKHKFNRHIHVCPNLKSLSPKQGKLYAFYACQSDHIYEKFYVESKTGTVKVDLNQNILYDKHSHHLHHKKQVKKLIDHDCDAISDLMKSNMNYVLDGNMKEGKELFN